MRAPRVLHWAAAAAALFMIAGLLRLGETELAVGLVPSPWDKLVHAATFGAMAFLVWLGSGQRWLVMCATAVFALACYDEWRQQMLPGREADLLDLSANAVGIVLAALIARRLSPPEI
ncbi:VanZ family protein [Methyloversatilis thermotolerans]|uniref:VanZ family protein n=1 Tax=Methyloversatilis thermotolerans TaxID=1346290 RepID=UPI00036FFB36|nr:VanZ family protein [Methyloversatilis thermotolerans]